MAVLPLVMTDQGLQPQAPADIRAQIVETVASTNEDYTANLPASMVEDVVSTDVAAVALSDSFLVDLVNSVTPNGANAFLLKQFGELYGLPVAGPANTSVFLVFVGPPGFVIVQGFTVSDGGYQYVCMDGGVIGTDGESLPMYAVATVPGTWAVPAGSVNQLVTSVPAEILAQGFAVSNIEDGLPWTEAESVADFRDRVMTAGLAASTGMSRYMKTLLANVPGVQKRLISARADISADPMRNGRFVPIVGGGDPYQVAYALYYAMFWLPGLIGASIDIIGMTSASPCVVATADNHNLLDGSTYRIDGVKGNGAFGACNGQSFVFSVIDPKTLSIDYPEATEDQSFWISGGTISPNPIVEQVTLTDWPDTYTVNYVIPAQETVGIICKWRTDSPNYVSASAMASAAIPALLDYVNSLPVGKTPINIYDMTAVFIEAVADILSAEAITFLTFDVTIDGTETAPGIDLTTGKSLGVIYGDRNSYFFAQFSDILVLEG